RLVLEAIAVGPHPRGGVLDQDARLADRARRVAESIVDRDQAVELAAGGVEPLDRRVVAVIEVLAGGTRAALQPLERGQPDPLARQRLVLAGGEAGAVDLLELEAEEL